MIVLVFLIAVIVLYFVVFYHYLSFLRNQILESFAELTGQLEPLFALVPRIIRFIRTSGYSEAEMMDALEDARDFAKTAQTPAEFGAVYDCINHGLARLRYIARQNPALHADEDYLSLDARLVELDEKVQFAREFYHKKMDRYNRNVELFPGRMAANIFRFGYWEAFTEDQEE